ncbi:hypothetical protein JEZ13_02475 [bacterium]|nr:hypothetical protein [bacterium]
MRKNIDTNMEIYDKICVDYIAETFNNYHQEGVEKFLKYVDGLEKILELGSGSGNNLTYIFGQGRSIQGSDNVLGFYEWIGSRFACPFAYIDFSDVDFVNDYIRDYEIKHLFCNLALQHLNLNQFQDFMNKIKFSGVFFFSLYDGTGENIDDKGIYSNYYKHRQIIKMLEARFEILEQWICDDVHKSERKMLNYVVKL